VIQPSDGVYAVMVRDLSASGPRELFAGVANLGTRPTFEAGRSLEVHLFDFQRDIYDAELRVGFVFKLRGEQRFAGVEELKRQITLDCDRAREMLRGATLEWMEQL
jgi:riboflavin kinase/FMN adenylyltransferase